MFFIRRLCFILHDIAILELSEAVYLFAQGGAQTCPGSGSCNCQLNNVESLRALVCSEVETQVEQEVVRRLANMPSKGCSYCYSNHNIISCLLYLSSYYYHPSMQGLVQE